MSESNSISPRQRMRALLAADACVAPASVHDPISARIAEHLEFELGIFAGSVASLTVLGAPDLILLTLTEFAEQARRITRASTLPILVDADHGYGNALNVMRCVQELETAGISAMSIEDTELPQPAGAGGKPRLVSIEEGVGKMRAALAARRDPALVIAGADVTRPDVLAANRVRICLRGHQPFAAATQAIYDTMRLLKEGTPGSELPGLASPALMKQLTRHDDHQAWSREYLDGQG